MINLSLLRIVCDHDNVMSLVLFSTDRGAPARCKQTNVGTAPGQLECTPNQVCVCVCVFVCGVCVCLLMVMGGGLLFQCTLTLVFDLCVLKKRICASCQLLLANMKKRTRDWVRAHVADVADGATTTTIHHHHHPTPPVKLLLANGYITTKRNVSKIGGGASRVVVVSTPPLQ